MLYIPRIERISEWHDVQLYAAARHYDLAVAKLEEDFDQTERLLYDLKWSQILRPITTKSSAS